MEPHCTGETPIPAFSGWTDACGGPVCQAARVAIKVIRQIDVCYLIFMIPANFNPGIYGNGDGGIYAADRLALLNGVNLSSKHTQGEMA
jgi:hypothetical protein